MSIRKKMKVKRIKCTNKGISERFEAPEENRQDFFHHSERITPSLNAVGRVRQARIKAKAGLSISVEESVKVEVLQEIGILQRAEVKDRRATGLWS